MSLLRTITLWLCGTLFSAALALCAFLFVFQLTVAKPTTVKTWFASSGAYEQVIPTLIDDNSQQDESVLPASFIRSALVAAFPADYVRTQSEQAVTSLYAWLDGSADTLRFSIPLQDRRSAFEASLVKSLSLQPSQIPECVSTPSRLICSAVGTYTANEATQFASQAGEKIGIFNSPLTAESIGVTPSTTPALSTIASLWQSTTPLLIASIATIILGATGIILLATDKLRSGRRLARSTFFSTLLTNVVLFVAVIATQSGGAITAAVKAPSYLTTLIAHILNDTAQTFLIFYIPVCIVSLAAWIILHRYITPPIPTTTPAQVPTTAVTPQSSVDSRVEPPRTPPPTV